MFLITPTTTPAIGWSDIGSWSVLGDLANPMGMETGSTARPSYQPRGDPTVSTIIAQNDQYHIYGIAKVYLFP
jgi:mannose-1-phosphate guanylyltransferase